MSPLGALKVLFEPVEDDAELSRVFPRVNHQELLAIGRDVVELTSAVRVLGIITRFEEHFRYAHTELRSGRDGNGHQEISVPIEELPTVARPYRLAAAARRDHLPATRTRVGLEVHLVLSGLVRHVSDETPVGREAG